MEGNNTTNGTGPNNDRNTYDFRVDHNFNQYEKFFFSGTIELQYKKQGDGSFKVTGTKVAWMNGGEVTIPPGR